MNVGVKLGNRRKSDSNSDGHVVYVDGDDRCSLGKIGGKIMNMVLNDR